MIKLFQLSIIIALIALPVRAARHPNARKGLKQALMHVGIYNVFYLLGLYFLFGRTNSTHALYMGIIFLVYRFAL